MEGLVPSADRLINSSAQHPLWPYCLTAVKYLWQRCFDLLLVHIYVLKSKQVACLTK